MTDTDTLVAARVAKRRSAEQESERVAIERDVRAELAAEANVAEAVALRIAAEDLADACAAAVAALEVRAAEETAKGRIGAAYEAGLDLARARIALADARDAGRYAQLAAYVAVNDIGPPVTWSDPNLHASGDVLALGQPPGLRD